MKREDERRNGDDDGFNENRHSMDQEKETGEMGRGGRGRDSIGSIRARTQLSIIVNKTRAIVTSRVPRRVNWLRIIE